MCNYWNQNYHTVKAECPSSHPYPLLGGGIYCCKWYRRTSDTGMHPKCDGGLIASNDPLECCFHGDYKACDGGRALCKKSADYSTFQIELMSILNLTEIKFIPQSKLNAP